MPPRSKPKPFSHHKSEPELVCDESPAVAKSRSRPKPFAHHKSEPELICDESPAVAKNASRKSLSSREGGTFLTGASGAMPKIAEAAVAGIDALQEEVVSSSGREVDAPDANGATALMLAIDSCPFKDLLQVVTLLLTYRADPNAADVAGDTPLTYCVQRNPAQLTAQERPFLDLRMLECVKMLLDYRADPQQCNRRLNQSPMQMSENLRGDNPLGEAMHRELRLRKVVEGLPDWRKGLAYPEIPARIEKALASAKNEGHHRVASQLEMYCKVVEVLKSYAGSLQIEFPPDSVGFVPAGSHSMTEPLRKALEAADLHLQLYGALPGAVANMIFDGLLPLQADALKQYDARYNNSATHASLIRFLASKREKYLHGYDWAFKELIEEQEAEGLAAVVALAAKFPAGQGADKPRQQTDVLAQVMIDASFAQRRVLLLAAAAAKHAGATHLVVKKKGTGGRAEPKQKRLFRSYEKVWLGTGPEGLLDVARGGVECPSMKSVQKALQYLLDESERGDLRLLRIKCRFQTASDGGWRDALVNFVFPDDPTQHVCELQIMHEKMMTIRADMGAHHDYAQFRGAAELLEFQDVDWLEEVKKYGTDRNDPATRMVELEAALRAKDRRIAELEAKLAALTSKGPEQADLDKITSAFHGLDVDGNGHIKKDEMINVFKSLGSSFTDEDYEKMFADVDRDCDGKIDYGEFVAWAFANNMQC